MTDLDRVMELLASLSTTAGLTGPELMELGEWACSPAFAAMREDAAQAATLRQQLAEAQKRAAVAECEREVMYVRVAEAQARVAQRDAQVAALVEAAQEILWSHPPAGTYPDGPCLDKQSRADLVKALAPFKETP